MPKKRNAPDTYAHIRQNNADAQKRRELSLMTAIAKQKQQARLARLLDAQQEMRKSKS